MNLAGGRKGNLPLLCHFVKDCFQPFLPFASENAPTILWTSVDMIFAIVDPVLIGFIFRKINIPKRFI
ncbi:hypothetical protein D2Q93_11055 [Alicyclobacillaceae bacterium I2511]|nr:hypothetical protein D2Q93_11055 [Alicyclobacillaceae bacterium I2511]